MPSESPENHYLYSRLEREREKKKNLLVPWEYRRGGIRVGPVFKYENGIKKHTSSAVSQGRAKVDIVGQDLKFNILCPQPPSLDLKIRDGAFKNF